MYALNLNRKRVITEGFSFLCCKSFKSTEKQFVQFMVVMQVSALTLAYLSSLADQNEPPTKYSSSNSNMARTWYAVNRKSSISFKRKSQAIWQQPIWIGVLESFWWTLDQKCVCLYVFIHTQLKASPSTWTYIYTTHTHSLQCQCKRTRAKM